MEIILLALVVAAAIAAYQWWRREQKQDAFKRWMLRDTLRPTVTPCGLDAGWLRTLRALPKGDRRNGVEFGATGPIRTTIAGEEVTLECAAFRWWWEDRQTSTNANGSTTTRYVKRTRIVGAISLPARVPPVSIAPENLLRRLGIGGRGGFQVESEEFNRRFDVRTVGERQIVIRLFDAQFQRFLLEMFAGRSIEMTGDVLLVAGDPAGREADLFGDIGRLPGARRDAALVASRIPPSFWRGLRATQDTAP